MPIPSSTEGHGGIVVIANGPVPRQLTLTAICDGAHARAQSFRGGGFIELYAAMMAAGWKDTSASGERRFLCPECSGKPSATDARRFF